VVIEEIFEFVSQKDGKYTRILNTKLQEVHKETNFGQMAVLLLFKYKKIPENNTCLKLRQNTHLKPSFSTI
jgi:hypothetical protein